MEPKDHRVRPSAIVLAAGLSSRFSGTKQLAEIAGSSLIQRVVDAIPPAGVAETVVVVGHRAAAVAKSISPRRDLKVVVNAHYKEGMSSSIRAGMSAVTKGAPAVILLLGDQPFVTKALLRRMLRAFHAGSKIVAAARGDLVAPPVIFSREYFAELEALEGDRGAKTVIDRHARDLARVDVRSGLDLTDVDTRKDLAAARRLVER